MIVLVEAYTIKSYNHKYVFKKFYQDYCLNTSNIWNTFFHPFFFKKIMNYCVYIKYVHYNISDNVSYDTPQKAILKQRVGAGLSLF